MTCTLERPAATLELAGNPDGPCVVVLGGISSSGHVTSTTSNTESGWWEGFVAPGGPIDSSRYRIAGMSYLDATTGDEALSTRDQAAALLAALDAAEIGTIHAIVGASYGGMVALAFCELAPSCAERLVVIAAAHESSPSATAQRSLQRRVVELGIRGGNDVDALVIARGMAITTYTTASDFDDRFDFYDPQEREVEIERFLTLGGQSFAARCTPDRFLSISRSLDLHTVAPESITTPATIISVIEDQLVPPSQARELAARLAGPVELNLISSPFGHDAFLEDHDLIGSIVKQRLSLSI